MNLDNDLLSIQEARDLSRKAKEAQQIFKHFEQEEVDRIVKAMYEAGYAASEKLARMAVDESGFGKYEDKIIKNRFATKNIYESIKSLKTTGVVASEANGKVLKIAVPMGVVCALIPSTNPTSTAMFKAIISVKTRNGIVASPHPKTIRCTVEALKILSDAAEAAGAPKGLIQCMMHSTLEGTDALMKDKNIAIILATGSNAMVKAAYSSGKPAYGVGAGNVPAFVERTANIAKAVADIVYGTTFDNGTLCSSEQAIIVDTPIKDKVIDELRKNNCYFVNKEEKIKLAAAVQKQGAINPEIVGKSASYIAKYAGFNVPENTKVLIADCFEVGRKEPLSMEKLSPVLAFYTAEGWLEGCHRCIELLNFGGIGHTMAIHSNDQPIIMKFALEKPAFRILVNTPASVGAVGYTTALSPSLTLGPGTWGGSIISDNVTARHLLNIKSVAFETNPINKGTSVTGFDMPVKAAGTSSFMKEIEERLRARAGNLPLNDASVQPKRDISTETQKPKEVKEPAKDKQLGTGLTEQEVNKIISQFKYEK